MEEDISKQLKKEYDKAYYLKNKQKRLRQNKEWYIKNREHKKEVEKEWVKNNPIKSKERMRRKVDNRSNYRKFIMPHCFQCGKTNEESLKETNKRLSVHHINGDHYDDREENCMTLCCACHQIVEPRRSISEV